MELCIVIPAYNEAKRIELTVRSYVLAFREYESQQQGSLTTSFVVVLNGCVDNTKEVIERIQAETSNVDMIEITQAGKGLAVRTGFAHAVKKRADLVGFVDADMATRPEFFFQLVQELKKKAADGIIASRYMYGAIVVPPRPFIKRWGSKAFFESFVRLLFWLPYDDFQCGAKLFSRTAIETVLPHLIVDQWAFDVELLYLCKKYALNIIEFPTIWFDQPGSKLRLSAGFLMIAAIFSLRVHHSPLPCMWRWICKQSSGLMSRINKIKSGM